MSLSLRAARQHVPASARLPPQRGIRRNGASVANTTRLQQSQPSHSAQSRTVSMDRSIRGVKKTASTRAPDSRRRHLPWRGQSAAPATVGRQDDHRRPDATRSGDVAGASLWPRHGNVVLAGKPRAAPQSPGNISTSPAVHAAPSAPARSSHRAISTRPRSSHRAISTTAQCGRRPQRSAQRQGCSLSLSLRAARQHVPALPRRASTRHSAR